MSGAILIWPSRFPRSRIAIDMGMPADRFLVVDGEFDRSARRLQGQSSTRVVLDPYYGTDAALMPLVRARFPDIVQGLEACRRRALQLSSEAGRRDPVEYSISRSGR